VGLLILETKHSLSTCEDKSTKIGAREREMIELGGGNKSTGYIGLELAGERVRASVSRPSLKNKVKEEKRG